MEINKKGNHAQRSRCKLDPCSDKDKKVLVNSLEKKRDRNLRAQTQKNRLKMERINSKYERKKNLARN